LRISRFGVRVLEHLRDDQPRSVEPTLQHAKREIVPVNRATAEHFANTTTKGPNGLLSLAATTVDSGSSLANLDAFIAARYKAEINGGFGFLNPAGVIRIAGDTSVTITVLGSPTGGTYTVLVNGNATGSIAYNATAATVKAAIVAADSGLNASNVTVTGSGPYSVTGPFTLSHGTDALTGGTSPSTTVA
jgi:hypothetical protein